MLSSLVFAILYCLPMSNFDLSDYETDTIMVTVQGEVKEVKQLELPKYSVLKDALDCVQLTEYADINSLNPQTVLKNEDVIVVPKISELEKISINYASFEELLLIPGIGESKANKIIAYREEYGLFQRLEDLMYIDGIKQKTFDKLKDYICL